MAPGGYLWYNVVNVFLFTTNKILFVVNKIA